MAEFVAGINPKILKWARERAGFSLEEVANAFKKDIETIRGWESGNNAPTYIQLEKLAYQLYKRPIALFFFPAPPEESDEKKEFRTLPDFEIENLSSDTLYALRQAKAMQLSLRELNDGKNPAERKIYREIPISFRDDLISTTDQVREYLAINLEDQIAWKNHDIALKAWRDSIEEKGIFIFKRTFKQADISGFCLIDEEFPLIYLNNSTSKSRQIFSIFHELAHILLQTNGITKSDTSYINALKGEAREIEIFCNQFAAEFLVPSKDFDRNLERNIFDDHFISDLASRYKVSREVILRKLLDRNLISKNDYEMKAKKWISEYEESKDRKKGGGDYYATQAAYLGENYLKLVFGKYYQGQCSLEQVADYLNMKVQNVPNLEQFLLGRALS